ncbi:MAG: sulfite exporter TauE/SafE family protein [Intrasporangium sp.]|uniref:sulfite exporter TauE/SafE family protein n=1 Tax=Intrasporangium sp. TaxID=1925024 RepID=UPI0026485FEE|nr:sulfite exporter TauE/SafE family protein [Intrasporangium sp.]MDN5796461.1 sulfite exporter TauE/SafE family protein [Intrasporangium sp.]
MSTLLVLGVVGFFAQFVDGALGMGYGATSASLLLTVGLTPALASASVHLAELGTNLASGVAHWRLGNVDRRLVLRLGVPGAVGAFLGATLLSHLATDAAAPVMGGVLFLLGAYILARFALRPPVIARATTSPHRRRFLVPLGFLGGVIDATGGGGWGPVSTTTLLSAGRTAPRTVVGSVDTSEFLVTASASIAFLVGLGTAGIHLGYVLVLLAGGVIAAPAAAWLVSRLPAPVLGSGVGGLIVVTNLRVLLDAVGASRDISQVAHLVVTAAWASLLTVAVMRQRFAVAARDPQRVKAINAS